ncbi:acyltransferase [Photobacterium sp. S4TG1]|uniref:acyltransferase family protein n=1 Tax=Photobacterium sp. S4TG1 TaxID=3114587 RepID=UPI002E19D8BA|nr:acyltransferase [Photobacterium sp. S4TG1]
MKNNNLNSIRLILALIVFIYHFCTLNHIQYYKYIPAKFAVYSFFSISGFLIINSWCENRNVRKFVISRISRLYPLYFIVILSFFFVGGVLYNGSYLSFIQTGGGEYLKFNLFFLNFIHPSLPELFSNNNITAVNGSLWTLKIEVMFYILVPVLFFSRKINSKILTGLFFLCSVLIGKIIAYFVFYYNLPLQINHQLPSLIAYFLMGYLVLSSKFDIKVIIILIPLSSIGYYYEVYSLSALYVALMVYVIVFKLPVIKIPTKIGDLSFGLYVWHFPIIQLFIMFDFYKKYGLIIGVIISLLVVLILSFFSWHCIEKPALKYSKKLY